MRIHTRLFFHYKDKKMAKAASRLLEEGEYAGILCSSYRTFPLPAAQYIAEKYHLPLVIDLRDIVEQYASNEYIAHNFRTFSWLDRKITEIFRHKLLRDRNNALRKADQVTTISPWHVENFKHTILTQSWFTTVTIQSSSILNNIGPLNSSSPIPDV